MNILIITDIARASHSVRPELEFIVKWQHLGHKVAIATAKTEYADYLADNGVDWFETNQKKKICFRTIKQVRQLIDDLEISIVYATNSKTIPTAAFACIGKSVKLVCYRGTISGLYRYDPTSYLTILHPRVNAVVCVSRAVQEAVDQKLLNKSVKTRTIYKGHELNWYNETPASRDQFGIKNNTFVICTVANFRPKKGLSVLLDALKEFHTDDDIALLIVGNGADKEPYKTIIAEHPLSEKIQVLGFRKDAPSIIAMANILAQPSIGGEGLPRTVVEALAYGTPVIATDTGGSKEILDDKSCGAIVKSGDANELSNALLQAFKTPSMYSTKACQQIITHKLSNMETAKQHLDFFEGLLTA